VICPNTETNVPPINPTIISKFLITFVSLNFGF
jgi:hypothetical protein